MRERGIPGLGLNHQVHEVSRIQTHVGTVKSGRGKLPSASEVDFIANALLSFPFRSARTSISR